MRFAMIVATLLCMSMPSHATDQAPGHPHTYITHKVSTDNAAAQFAFERGLTLVFAYQRDEAEQAFRQAARLDPGLAMAWWGIGLALGPDINSPPKAKTTLEGAQALARAQKLAVARSTPAERDYIQALATRYTTATPPDFDALAKAYRDAMEALAAKYPSDMDAQALFAEAIMDQRPWRLWTPGGEPAQDTELLVRTIENGLKLRPDHIGLLHFYIHAVEASTTPERALVAARRLGATPMEPAAAHLVHMPAHIYLRVGDWQSAVDANRISAEKALAFRLSKNPAAELACGHCLDFLTYAYATQGDATHALEVAASYTQLSGDPSNEFSVLVRFGHWDSVLIHPEPAGNLKPDSRSADVMRGYWHYARGLALSATNRAERAAEELAALRKSAAAAKPEPEWDSTHLDLEHLFDKMESASDAVVLKIAERVLAADLQEKAGHVDAAVTLLQEAVTLQDRVQYGEPPAWFYPVREKLGVVLLRAGRANAAEAMLRLALQRTPNNPRALFALSASLKAQGKSAEAAVQHEAFTKAWHSGGGTLTLAAL